MQTEQPKKANESPLQSGNTALRQGDKAGAIRHYVQALVDSPGLHRIISANLVMARQKYRAERNNASKPRVGVCGWELAHNAAGRVYTLAMLYETFADVEIIGSLFPNHGREVWEPIRSTPIAKHSFVVEDEARFMDQAIQLVAAHPYDIVHLSKPRAPNIFFGILYKLIWDARVLMDIDDEELAFVDAETPISADDYIRQHGKLPDLKHLAGKDWTRLAVGMVNGFDGITVCNTALQQRYGGEIIRHARDEKLFNPSPELTRKCREKFGIPQDKKVVLFFGTPREHKGLIETARAIAELKKPEVLFCIAGDFPDTALKKKLQEIKGCQIAFLPNQPFKAIPQVVSIADCCVLMHDEQSLAGRFQTPAKLSDALAMGLQVLTNSTAALTGLNEPDAVTVVSHGTLCAALQKVLFNQPLSPKLQSKARQLFEAELTIGVNAPRLKKIATTGQVTVFRDSEYLKLIPLPMGVLRNGATPSRSGMHDAPAKEEVRSLDVDVVVPVYNALDDVRRCLESLSRHTDGLQVRIIVVNDGSEQPTTDWLRTFCTGRPGLHLIENPVNLGYTKTVNTGLRFSNAPYVITQNSDTIVSEGWLKGLIRCMESNETIGIVGPLSNAASWQNVPSLLDEKGAFAVNEIPDGMGVDEMARLVARVSTRSYPRLPFVNGFCFMIHRRVIDVIGYMDEENFPIGYGEENDFCIRAADAGFNLAIADDVYVFHAKSKSFGHQQRKILSEQGSQNLKKKHTPEKFKAKVDAVKKTDQLDIVRTQIQDALRARSVNVSQIDLRTMRILFLLPVKGGSGGAHSVVQEVSEMRRLGIHAHIAMKHDQVEGFIRGYTDIPGSQDTFIGFDNDSLLDIAEDFDIVVGTIFNSMSLVQRVVEANPSILPAYYVQDYEPLFFEVDTPNWHLARDSYTLVPGACLFAKTQWIIDEVKSHHGVQVHKVEPSIDHEVYKLQSRSSSGGIQIAAMIRPQTPRRGAERTMRLLERLHGLLGDAIAVNLFGCPSDAPEFLRLSRNFAFVNHGLLSRTEVATLLGQSDIFIDLSDYQAFGRTALEGMASGCAAFVPAVGGAHEYARHDQTALIVDTTNEAACFEAVYALVTDPPRLKRLQRAGLKTAARYSVHAAAVSELLVLEKSLALWRSAHPRRDKGSLVIIPESTEPGVPTVTGYVRGILPYLTPAVRQLWKVSQAASLPHPGSANAVLIQRDAMGIHIDDLQAWLPNWRALGGKLIFELDDDLLTEAAMLRHPSKDNVASVVRKVRYLSQQADLVVTSTESLAHQLAGLNNNVKIIPTALDANLWQLDRPRIHTEGQFKRKPFEMVRIGYFGTNDQYADLEIVREAMRVIENKYGATVEIEVIGTFQNKKPLFGKRVGLPKKNDYPQFVNWLLQRVHWDIGILPQRNKYNDATSSLKFLEYTALDMAILTSDHEDVQSLAVPGQNCLVANDSVDSWVQQLSRLIEDSDLRSRLANCGREIFKSNYTNRSNEFFVSDYLRKLIS